MNGNDMLEFEEAHYEDLIESFIKKNSEAWAKHIEEEQVSYMASKADADYEAYMDSLIEE